MIHDNKKYRKPCSRHRYIPIPTRIEGSKLITIALIVVLPLSGEVNHINDRAGNVIGLSQSSDASEDSEGDQSLVLLRDRDLGGMSDEVDNVLLEAYKTKTPAIPQHRKDLMEEASTFIKDTLPSMKIADVVSIAGPGPVHVGHVINITEQIVLNTKNNELECGSQKSRDYTDYFATVDRMHWLAQPSVADPDYFEAPTKYVIICHTATQEAFTQAENVLMLRLLQTFHIESQGWADIAYNFCIGSDGNVYEGRGWLCQGSHTVSYNKYSIGIAFIGCFINHLPPKTALKRCQDLIAHGVHIGAISPDYELIGHCQCRPFLSPGQRLFEELKTWKNFNPDITHTSPCIFKL